MADRRREARGRRGARYRAAAVCTPGLEDLTRAELTELGIRPRAAGPGTIEFDATARQLYAANVWLRTATRVLVRVATFRATDFDHLQRRAGEVDWSPWLADGVAPRFRVSSSDSKLYHTDAVAERLHDVVGPPAELDAAGDHADDAQTFVVRIDRNTVTISADASGAPLHHRPWRTHLGDAPLRATMAAAVVLASGWDPATPLADPFCGSGVIPIEAALIARRLPPGGDRRFAFQRWPDFEPGSWASVTGAVDAEARGTCPAPIEASDRDAGAVAGAQANAEAAGVADDVTFEAGVVGHLGARQGPGMVVTNPPYGRRMGDGSLAPLYRRLGAVVRERRPGHGLAIVGPSRKLARAADRALTPVVRFRHGGLAVALHARPAPAPIPADAPAAQDDAAEVDRGGVSG